MSVRDDRFHLVHIPECIRNIEEDTAGGKAAFFANRTLRDAVMRNLQVLPESAKRITDTFKEQHPEVP